MEQGEVSCLDCWCCNDDCRIERPVDRTVSCLKDTRGEGRFSIAFAEFLKRQVQGYRSRFLKTNVWPTQLPVIRELDYAGYFVHGAQIAKAAPLDSRLVLKFGGFLDAEKLVWKATSLDGVSSRVLDGEGLALLQHLHLHSAPKSKCSEEKTKWSAAWSISLVVSLKFPTVRYDQPVKQRKYLLATVTLPEL